MKQRDSIQRRIFLTTLVFVLSGYFVSAFALSWEESEDAAIFERGDIEAVGRLITTEPAYKNPGIVVRALQAAISSRQVELVKFLKTQGWFDVCLKRASCNPIHIAAQAGDSGEIMSLFVAEGFDPDAEDRVRYTPLHAAAAAGQLAAVKYLCGIGVDAAKISLDERTPLQEAKSRFAQTTRQPGNAYESELGRKLDQVIKYLESGQCKKR